MALDLFSGIVAVLHNFPKHAFWIFEQIFFFDVVQRVWVFKPNCFCVFSDLCLVVCTTIWVLMIDPPVTIARPRYFCDKILFWVWRKCYCKIRSQNICGCFGLLATLKYIFEVVIIETMWLLGPCITSDCYLRLLLRPFLRLPFRLLSFINRFGHFWLLQ